MTKPSQQLRERRLAACPPGLIREIMETRYRLGIRQGQMAAILDVSQPVLCQWESGQRQMKHPRRVEILFRLGVADFAKRKKARKARAAIDSRPPEV